MRSLKTYTAKDSSHGFKSERGFTLIEALVVMAIMTMLAGTSLIVSMDSYRGFAFRGERDNLVASLVRARSQSMNNICLGGGCTDGKPHGVYVETGRYVIFQGASYAARDSAVDEILFVQNSTVRFGTTSVEVVFAQLSGDVVTAKDIGVTDDVSHYSTTSVNTEGRISWTN